LDSSSIIQIIILFLLLLLSAFFSSAETSFMTVNKIRMRTLAEDGDKRAQVVLQITENPSKMLSAVLIGNNIVNLSASSLATALAIRILGSMGAGIATGILTLLILIFGEITPKNLATIHAEKLALTYAHVIRTLMTVMTPLIVVVNGLSFGVLRLLRVDPNKQTNTMTEDELRTIVDVGQENGIIEDDERDIIHNVFDFTDTEAKEVMVPRIQMDFVDVKISYQELYEIFYETRHTRIPVYEESRDNVVGIINIKDLIFCEDKEHFSLRDMMREPYFTYEHKNTSELLQEMRKNSISIAIVLDEYGATAGMVTMEDLLEELVGEIHDEYDENEEADITELEDGSYLIVGSANLEDVCEELDLPFESENSDSIGGFFIEKLGHLPKEGEEVTTEEGYKLTVTEMEKNRIEKIHLESAKSEDAEEPENDEKTENAKTEKNLKSETVTRPENHSDAEADEKSHL
jgi:putative hemolysin